MRFDKVEEIIWNVKYSQSRTISHYFQWNLLNFGKWTEWQIDSVACFLAVIFMHIEKIGYISKWYIFHIITCIMIILYGAVCHIKDKASSSHLGKEKNILCLRKVTHSNK